MPRASVTSAAAVKPGARRSTRAPWRRSRTESSSSAGRISSRVLSLTRSSPPNLSSAWRRASSGLMPARRCFCGLLIDVKTNLFVETALERVAPADRADPLPALCDPSHDASQLFDGRLEHQVDRARHAAPLHDVAPFECQGERLAGHPERFFGFHQPHRDFRRSCAGWLEEATCSTSPLYVRSLTIPTLEICRVVGAAAALVLRDLRVGAQGTRAHRVGGTRRNDRHRCNAVLHPSLERRRDARARVGSLHVPHAELVRPGPPLQCCMPGTRYRRAKSLVSFAPILTDTDA